MKKESMKTLVCLHFLREYDSTSTKLFYITKIQHLSWLSTRKIKPSVILTMCHNQIRRPRTIFNQMQWMHLYIYMYTMYYRIGQNHLKNNTHN